MVLEPAAATEGFKALGDPIRWNILQQIAQHEELACSTLEDTLPVSKPTISYHTKILSQAGLIGVRKQGRNYFYSVRQDALRALIDELSELAPGLRLVGEPARTSRRASASPGGPGGSGGPAGPITAVGALRRAASDDALPPPTLLTW
jgi:DNA-binding transcriptional ArsR family regulator